MARIRQTNANRIINDVSVCDDRMACSPLSPLQHGCVDNWTWSKQDQSPDVTLYDEDHSRVTFNCKRAFAIRGTDALNSVSHYWEVKVDNSNGSGNALLGVGTAKAAVEFRETRPRINLLTHSESWVLDCTSGYLHQDGQGRMFTEFTKLIPRNRFSNGSIDYCDWNVVR